MQLNKNTKLKTFEIWVSKGEKDNLNKNGNLSSLLKMCNEYGYTPVIYVSGSNDFMSGMTEIVFHKAKNTAA